MGQALYRKYRPKSLKEVVGQKHITDTLSNAIASGKISHAYLLTGPRGVGKTSIARILAHEINGLEYEELISHMDIIEIDAASNRRIDEIRDLRDKVNILPTTAKYKVYIIDEVHMLTREAFNALLKTLEEPPAHAIFILATTESHKLPDTIISRTQHYSFKPIENSVLIDHLKGIAKKEKLTIDDKALELIAEHGEGSFRDSISLLDQARSLSDEVNLKHVQQLLGIAPASSIEKLLTMLSNGTPKELMELLVSLRDQGIQSSIIAKQLSKFIRNKILSDANYQNVLVTNLLENLLSIPASSQPDRKLEIVLLEYIFSQNHQSQGNTIASNNSPVMAEVKTVAETVKIKQAPVANVSKTNETAGKKPELKAETNSEPNKEQAESSEQTKPKTATQYVSTEKFSVEAWPLIVAQVKKSNNTLYGILRMANASFENDTLTLAFSFTFHQKQINESKNRKIIEDIIKRQTGDKIILNCIVAKRTKPSDIKPSVDLDTVSNIFGGGEVLESGV